MKSWVVRGEVEGSWNDSRRRGDTLPRVVRVSRGVVTGPTVVPLVQPQSPKEHLTTASLVLVCLVCLAPELDHKLTHARTIQEAPGPSTRPVSGDLAQSSLQ